MLPEVLPGTEVPAGLFSLQLRRQVWLPEVLYTQDSIEKLGLSISETGIFREYLDARKGKAVNHCCIYGVFCAEMQISLEEALTHYLYAQTSAIVTNCVKTIPLSQTSGQQLLSGCYGEFDEILKDVMNRSEEDLCLSAPGFDIRGIQHEKLYSRLYMS